MSAAVSCGPVARAGKLSDSTLHLEVRTCIAESISEPSCIAKKLPLGLPIITAIKKQVDILLDLDDDVPSINLHHHHIVRSCKCSDPAKQQLLLNVLLQECNTRIAQHSDEIQRRREARRIEPTVTVPECPFLTFIGTDGLTKLRLTYLTCVRQQASARKFNTAAVLPTTYVEEVLFVLCVVVVCLCVPPVLYHSVCMSAQRRALLHYVIFALVILRSASEL